MQSDFFQQTSKVLTVAELTRAIRGALETKFGAVWVQGEISNYKLHPSGHQYFTLKDQRAAVACVIFRNTLPTDAPRLADGAQVQIYGNITVFEARGQYQLSVQIVQSRGAGLLQAKFESLKRKLEAEGLFDPSRKRPLPRFPRRIGIITSASGAAIRDVLNVLQRRAPALQILINPVRVQGIGAATEIAVAIRELAAPNKEWEPLDLIVITRGGGSIEDLWEFNEEIVARAIVDSPLPIVSAVGHEVDFTIADFVADLRAPTPSAAAELIVPDMLDLLRRVDERSARLKRNLRSFLKHSQTRLRFLSEKTLARELQQRLRDAQQTIDLARESFARITSRVLLQARTTLGARAQTLQAHSPARQLAARAERVKEFQRRLASLPTVMVQTARQRFHRIEGILRVLGPDATLRRGYSITTDESGKLIREVAQAKPQRRIRTRVQDGIFNATVE
ncbi:MAG: exodeoxyribonuclease VII large subunit [Chthoniobacterales bacterium]